MALYKLKVKQVNILLLKSLFNTLNLALKKFEFSKTYVTLLYILQK